MTPRNTLPIDVLRELISYDPETGALTWLPREPKHFTGEHRMSPKGRAAQWNGQFAGKPAITTRSATGYRKGTIFCRHFFAHRIAFALHHGFWPEEIDHINGDKADNRACNLRQATPSQNNRNRALPSTNKSGRIGVHYYQLGDCWRAHAKVGGRQVHLGSFQTRQAAVAAREKFERENGFHPNHGRAA